MKIKMRLTVVVIFGTSKTGPLLKFNFENFIIFCYFLMTFFNSRRLFISVLNRIINNLTAIF